MELWTLSELAERVEAALTDYPGQANGRVRPVPDQRAIRWYTTTGLIDRPAEMRGRTALYGRRHLLQLVAIKRRQSQGHSLAQIQSELAGAPNQTLEPIAALPNPLPPNPPKAPPAPLAPGEAGGAVSAAGGPVPGAGAAAESDTSALASQRALPRARFWANHSPEASPATPAPGDAPHPAPAPFGAADRDVLAVGAAFDSASRAATSQRDLPPETPGALVPGVSVVGAFRLGEGVTVVLDRGVGELDAERLAAAAAPFLAELRRQGILPRSSGDEL